VDREIVRSEKKIRTRFFEKVRKIFRSWTRHSEFPIRVNGHVEKFPNQKPMIVERSPAYFFVLTTRLRASRAEIIQTEAPHHVWVLGAAGVRSHRRSGLTNPA